MSKPLDQLARNLASGMSRRKALWQFVSGLGVVAALTGRKAYAKSPFCAEFCAVQAEIFYGLCLEASLCCGPGCCAEFSLITLNSTTVFAATGTKSTIGINGGPWICVPCGGTPG
jgi:hypothetical protein